MSIGHQPVLSKPLVEEALTEQIIGAAIEVHQHFGPGCLSQHTKNVSAMNCSFEDSVFDAK